MHAPRPASLASSLSPLVAAALAALALAGCGEKLKASEQGAADELARLAPVVKEDVEQVRRGLPEGAAKLGKGLDADALGDPLGLQRAIAGARAHTKDLDVAKSTFFSLTDTSGTVLRSEVDPDLLVGKSIVATFPALKPALTGGGVVEAFGEMPELRGVRNGPDLAWVVAHPVKGANDQPVGMFVTGWSFRRFAYHLDETAKRHLVEAAEKAGKKKTPLIYTFMIKGKKAYGAPLTPDVNAQAVENLDLIAKTASGPYRGTLEIADRGFGVAAQRTPELGDDAALVVLLSEY